ncbi:MAG: hypothetical protein ACOX5J_17910, partial [Candidatus Hydrogenedentales bacterium]
YWEYVMDKSSSDPHGRPWTSPLHDQSRRYTPDMCPQTLDILGRSIHIDITQRYEQKHVDWIVQAVQEGGRGACLKQKRAAATNTNCARIE